MSYFCCCSSSPLFFKLSSFILSSRSSTFLSFFSLRQGVLVLRELTRRSPRGFALRDDKKEEIASLTLAMTPLRFPITLVLEIIDRGTLGNDFWRRVGECGQCQALFICLLYYFDALTFWCTSFPPACFSSPSESLWLALYSASRFDSGWIDEGSLLRTPRWIECRSINLLSSPLLDLKSGFLYSEYWLDYAMICGITSIFGYYAAFSVD